MKKSIVACFSLVAILRTSAPAYASITEYVLPQPDSPIQIASCNTSLQFSSNRWGTNSSELVTGADFQNVSAKVAIEVVFRLRLSNALGALMDNILGQVTGQFSPNSLIKGNKWSQTDAWPGLGEVQCSVARVLFADGTDWNAPKVASSPSPLPSPS